MVPQLDLSGFDVLRGHHASGIVYEALQAPIPLDASGPRPPQLLGRQPSKTGSSFLFQAVLTKKISIQMAKQDQEKRSIDEIENQRSRGIPREFWDFVRENKKYWLLPLVFTLLLLGSLILFAGSSAAPFIYTLF